MSLCPSSPSLSFDSGRHLTMGRRHSLSSLSRYRDFGGDLESDPDLECPFGRMGSLGRSDLREAAYELFFTSCRSSPGFSGSRGSLNYYPACGAGEGSLRPGSSTRMTAPRSRIKKALGLAARRSLPMITGMLSNWNRSPGKAKRPMTSAEIMRQQMRVNEKNDRRLRKMLTRTLAGQTGKRAETIILPLELLRQLKPSEFHDLEYHQWQRRQLKLLEAGLLLHPTFPVDPQNPAGICLHDLVRGSEFKPLDTSKNSESMRALYSSVVSLASRSPGGDPSTEVCHWADGFPFNIHLYIALLRSVFDLREETVVLDEVDELLELMKKTWPTLGINRAVHNLCFAWLFFQRYIETGEIEPDLLCATLAMLVEIAGDARKPEREANYVKLLTGVVKVMQRWSERRALDYHAYFGRESLTRMELVVSLAISTSKILGEDASIGGASFGERGGVVWADASESRADCYIMSSIRKAFTKTLENGASQDESTIVKLEDDPSDILLTLAKDTEELALAEKELFSPVLKRWHPMPTACAVVTIHGCFGIVLRQYLNKTTRLTNELVGLLLSAGKLEKLLMQLVVEGNADCEDDGKNIVTEMVPYDVDSIITGFLKAWIEERLRIAKECLNRAKETESWMPKSKNEPYAPSAVDLMKLAQLAVDEFFEIPVEARDDMVHDLADGLESIFQEYISFVAVCGTKQSYVPSLPPLTRCNQDSGFFKLWKRAAVRCTARSACAEANGGPPTAHHPRPSTSRGTQRLYIRLNTLHFVLPHLHALDKSLSFHSLSGATNRRLAPPSPHFALARSAAQSAIQYVAEVAAHRLIFLDSRHSFYDGLYVNGVADARIGPALRVLKQNLTLLVSILIDRAQPQAVREVMRAALGAFLMVLLAGGAERAFMRADSDLVAEDLRRLKRAFCACGEGLVAEEVADREAEVAEGVVALMALPTERLIEDLSIIACETSGVVVNFDSEGAEAAKLPMPPTTGRWHRTDPNTVLRVLAHRDDEVANEFLKRTFQLPKRR